MTDLNNRNVLVTGGAGFIGSHLVERLINLNANVIVPYQSLNPKSYFASHRLDKKVILVHKDIKNFRRTLDVITKYEVDIIFHLAAQAIVPTAYYNPLETLETNIMGTANVLEAARLYGNVKAIIIVSSDKAYGKISRAAETAFLSGDHPYEISKVAADLLATTYFKTYSLPVVIIRFGNVFGEGDLNFNRIIPGIMKSLILNKTLIVRSNGKYIRDYVYVGDIVEALVMLVKQIKKIYGEAFNISSLENLSVIQLINKCEKVLGQKVKYQIIGTAVNEIPVQSINFNKIKKTFGWKPKTNLKTTIPAIYDWYKSYFDSVK